MSLKRVLNWNQIYQTCCYLLQSHFLLVSLKKGNCRSPIRYRQETKEQEGAKIHFLRITAAFHPRNLLEVHRGMVYLNIQQKSAVVLFSESFYIWTNFGLKLMYLFQAWYQWNLMREKTGKDLCRLESVLLIRKTWVIKKNRNGFFKDETVVFSKTSNRHNTPGNSCKHIVKECSRSLLQICTLTHGRHFKKDMYLLNQGTELYGMSCIVIITDCFA